MKTPMKNILKTILAATFLMSAGASFAQDTDAGSGKPGKPGARGQRSMQGMPMVEHLMHALHRLDLDEEQKTSIRAVMKNMKAEVRPVMEEMKHGHQQLKGLIKADEFDEDAVAELAAKEGDLTAQRVMISSRALSEVYSFLTGEQRVELEEMAAERMERRSKKRKQRTTEG